jgi:hypothetical protein
MSVTALKYDGASLIEHPSPTMLPTLVIYERWRVGDGPLATQPSPRRVGCKSGARTVLGDAYLAKAFCTIVPKGRLSCPETLNFCPV